MTAVSDYCSVQLNSFSSLFRRVSIYFGIVKDWVARRRTFVTTLVFAGLILEDILYGVRPHSVFDFTDIHSVLGLALISSGLLLRSWAAGVLRKNEQLATTGPYSLIRNPLYVGSLMMMLGFACIIDDPQNILVILGPMMLLYCFWVRREEKSLHARFGTEWETYSQIIPRFIPRFMHCNFSAPWSLPQWMRSREYQAVLSSIGGLLALQIWRMLK